MATKLNCSIDANCFNKFDYDAPIEHNLENWKDDLVINFHDDNHDESKNNPSDSEVEPAMSVQPESDMTYIQVLEMVGMVTDNNVTL